MGKLSFDAIQAAVRTALNEGRTEDQYYVVELFDDYVVYKSWNQPEYWQRDYTIDKNGKVTFDGSAEEVRRVVKYEAIKVDATFSLDSEGEKGTEMVTYSGPIFKLGTYPDKAFSMNRAEGDNAVAKHSPAEVDLEHLQTPLDGKMGKVTQLWRNGDWIHGRWECPKALRTLLGKKVKVSAHWDRETKTLTKLALTENPRITGASLAAAFSDERSEEAMDDATFTEKLKAGLAAIFGVKSNEQQNPNPSFNSSPDPDAERLRRENDTLKTQLASQNEGRLADTAAQFADEQVAAGKIDPCERDGLVNTFKRLAKADASESGAALFSGDGTFVEGPGIKDLKAQYAARAGSKVHSEDARFTMVTGSNAGATKLDTPDEIYRRRAEQQGGGRR